ncbi:MAG: hypothetical protein J6K04_07220 [Lachnospiraceae bacterium]|nr:hypothetical protein [Lachnospiraceae bacterium]
MTEQIKALELILIVNAVIVVIYWLIAVIVENKGDRRSFLIRGIVMLLCPVIGPCFFALSQVLFKTLFSQPVDLEGVIFSKERVRTFIRADEDSERNMVPLEEAIEVADTDDLRNLMMNIVRGDVHKSLSAIALALNSEDTETSHYAASVLQDALNDFRNMVQKGQMELASSEKNREVSAGILLEYMNQVLEQKVLTEVEQKDYVCIMDEIAEVLYETAKERMTSSQFEAVSLRLLEIKDFENCQKWCERAVYQYPNTLATFTCQLKLYFNSGQKERFFEVIEELKKSAIVIDNETLELIRVFH